MMATPGSWRFSTFPLLLLKWFKFTMFETSYHRGLGCSMLQIQQVAYFISFDTKNFMHFMQCLWIWGHCDANRFQPFSGQLVSGVSLRGELPRWITRVSCEGPESHFDGQGCRLFRAFFSDSSVLFGMLPPSRYPVRQKGQDDDMQR